MKTRRSIRSKWRRHGKPGSLKSFARGLVGKGAVHLVNGALHAMSPDAGVALAWLSGKRLLGAP